MSPPPLPLKVEGHVPQLLWQRRSWFKNMSVTKLLKFLCHHHTIKDLSNTNACELMNRNVTCVISVSAKNSKNRRTSLSYYVRRHSSVAVWLVDSHYVTVVMATCHVSAGQVVSDRQHSEQARSRPRDRVVIALNRLKSSAHHAMSSEANYWAVSAEKLDVTVAYNPLKHSGIRQLH